MILVQRLEPATHRSGPVHGVWLFSTPWVCAYVPVRMLAREGLHRDVVLKVFSNTIPSSASLSSPGVLTKGWCM